MNNMKLINRLREWRKLMKVKRSIEDPQVTAGRVAEQFLRTLIESNLEHKGAFCFLGKRVPAQRQRRRFEVDLIVLTKKQLHFLEVKNWSGELLEDGNNWIQVRRNGERIKHPNLATYNLQKQQAVVEYLRSHGVELDSKYFSHKIIFMNSNLALAPSISANPNIVPRNRLDNYLATQSGASYAERFVHSLVELCIDANKSGAILDVLFHAMPGKYFDTTRQALAALETWDKVVLHGGKVLTGDCLKLFTREATIDLKSLPGGTRCRVSWTRSRFVGFLQVLFTQISLGKIALPDHRMPVDPSGILKFHSVGDDKPGDIPMANVNLIVRG